MRLFLLLAFCLIATPAPAPAQEPEWRIARDYEVGLSPFDIEPTEMRLVAGRPVKLHFVNQGRSTLSISAGDFFRRARVRSGDHEHVADGHLRLAPGERRSIALAPARGRYRMRSGNLVHRMLGMSALIIVE